MAAGDNEELATQVREANRKLAINLTLIEQALPLEEEELARIYQNVAPWLLP